MHRASRRNASSTSSLEDAIVTSRPLFSTLRQSEDARHDAVWGWFALHSSLCAPWRIHESRMYPAACLLNSTTPRNSDCAGTPQQARRGLVHRYRIVWRCKAFRGPWWCCEEGRLGCGKRRRAYMRYWRSRACRFYDHTFTTPSRFVCAGQSSALLARSIASLSLHLTSSI
jgi:hypothetical protein